MLLNTELHEIYEEFSYLNTQKSLYYRTIIRYMYNELQRREFIYRFDVFNHMKQFNEFSDYTEEECYKDLDFLCEKGNLLKYKNDYSAIKSIEEIKKKKFRYQLTDKTWIIEDILINRFNKINALTVVLDKNLLKNFKKELLKFLERKSDFLELSNKEIHLWWSSLDRAFEELRRNYQEYIKNVNNFEYDKIIDSDEFLLKKSRLKEYLEEFIIGLMEEGGEIKQILLELEKSNDFEKLLEKIVEASHEYASMTNNENKTTSRKRVFNLKDKMYNWFVGKDGDNEIENLRTNTINVINKIIKLSSKFIARKKVNYSRKESYKKVLKTFLTCSDIEEAHKFSGILFGVNEVKHFRGENKTENIEEFTDSFKNQKLFIEVKKLTERSNEKKKIFFADKSIEKANYMRKKEAEIQKQKTELEKYIHNGLLEIEKLPTVAGYTKNIILEYIKKGISNPPQQGENMVVINNKMYKEYKQSDFNNHFFNLLMPYEEMDRCVMKTDEGNLEMPSFIIKFGGK